ncbi:hypothetical protein GIB67_012064, partial [Kingdonia uniflora]
MEYWEEKSLMSVAITVGRPVHVDENTLIARTGFYAIVLTEVDLAKPIPSKIFVDGDDDGFMQDVVLGSGVNEVDHTEAGCSKSGEGVKEGISSPISLCCVVPLAQCSIPLDILAIMLGDGVRVAETWVDLADL